jgi:hypothetical protein
LKRLLIYSAICILLSCNKKFVDNKNEYVIVKKGVLFSIGEGIEYYFLDTETIDEISIEKSLLDTGNIAIQLGGIMENSGLNSILEKMKPFKYNFFKCGVWSPENLIKYIAVRIYFKKGEVIETEQRKINYSAINKLCLFRVTENATFSADIKYKFINAYLKK